MKILNFNFFTLDSMTKIMKALVNIVLKFVIYTCYYIMFMTAYVIFTDTTVNALSMRLDNLVIFEKMILQFMLKHKFEICTGVVILNFYRGCYHIIKDLLKDIKNVYYIKK